jgi:hypothetical protein
VECRVCNCIKNLLFLNCHKKIELSNSKKIEFEITKCIIRLKIQLQMVSIKKEHAEAKKRGQLHARIERLNRRRARIIQVALFRAAIAIHNDQARLDGLHLGGVVGRAGVAAGAGGVGAGGVGARLNVAAAVGQHGAPNVAPNVHRRLFA